MFSLNLSLSFTKMASTLKRTPTICNLYTIYESNENQRIEIIDEILNDLSDICNRIAEAEKTLRSVIDELNETNDPRKRQYLGNLLNAIDKDLEGLLVERENLEMKLGAF